MTTEACTAGSIAPVDPVPRWEFENCAAESGETVAIVGRNCYNRTGNKVNFFDAEKVGFKNVLARKAWHGRYPFDAVCSCPDATNPQTRYLKMERSVVYKFTNREWKFPAGGATGPFEFHFGWNITYKATITIDRESGVYTVSNFERSYLLTERTYAEAEADPPELITRDIYAEIPSTTDEVSYLLSRFVYCDGWQNNDIYTQNPSITVANAQAYDIWQKLIELDTTSCCNSCAPLAGIPTSGGFCRETDRKLLSGRCAVQLIGNCFLTDRKLLSGRSAV